ncbi:MAG: hypothetical protein J6U73_07640 [Alistipes sp.]|nr:hypothetical protein [Alistipes sp.]
MIANWQDKAVVFIAVVVSILVVRRILRFFICGDSCSCSECGKECSHRRNKKQIK